MHPVSHLSQITGGLGLLAISATNAWSADQNRKSNERISAANREHSERMQLTQMKFAMLQQQDMQDFQRELAQFNAEQARELEAFRQSVNIAIHQENLDFQKWRFEQERQLQYDMLQLSQAFQRETIQTQHQNALVQIRDRVRVDHSPVINLAADLLESSYANGVMPLKILLSPPVLDYDSQRQSSGTGYESFLAEEIRQFLHQGYLNSDQYPVQLLDKAWSTKRQGGGSAVHALHAQLKSTPVLVLESEIVGDELNLRVGYWSGGNAPLTESSILSRFPFEEFLYEAAKNRALAWKETRQKLAALGKSEEFLQKMGGVNEENLRVLESEIAEKAELEQHGIDISEFPFSKNYRITDKDYKNFYEFLAAWHCLLIGVFADILFLSRSWENTPLLPTLFPYLLTKYKKNQFPAEFWQTAITGNVAFYGELYNSLGEEFRWLPELKMRFAQCLADLPEEYQHLALEQADSAVSAWLKSNNVPSDKLFDVNNDEDCQLLKRIIYQEDKPLFQSLQEVLAKVGNNTAIDSSKREKINRLLVGWQFLNRWGVVPQLPTIATGSETAHKNFTETTDIYTKQFLAVTTGSETVHKNFTETINDHVHLEMIAIPAGEFLMGSPAGEGEDSEKPQHKVSIPPFYISKYLVTNVQCRAVLSLPKVARNFYDCVLKSHLISYADPVVKISWFEAVEFCQRLSKHTGREYRLPTEAEWEYACRAGTVTPFYFGETITHDLAIYTHGDQFKHMTRMNCPKYVGRRPPNAFGLYDMHGNVSEWCADAWHENYDGAPTDGSAWTHGGKDNYSPLRGGSWSTDADECRSASRTDSYRETNWEDVGFRVVCGADSTLFYQS